MTSLNEKHNKSNTRGDDFYSQGDKLPNPDSVVLFLSMYPQNNDGIKEGSFHNTQDGLPFEYS